MNSTPSVSVLMTVLNGERYVESAIRSILDQTLRDLEVVVVDDASTDATPGILARVAEEDPRIRILTNQVNLGIPASANRGLAECRAPLVARMDADDLSAPDRLEKQLAFLAANPDVGMMSCVFHRIDADGNHLQTADLPLTDDLIRIRQLFISSFVHSGLVVRSTVAEAVGGYDESFWTAEDVDFCVRLGQVTRMAIHPEPLVSYRVHATSHMKKRSVAGHRKSLSIPSRLVSAYLARELTVDDVKQMVMLFQAFEKLDEPSIWKGLDGLREVYQVAKLREKRATIRYLRQQIARAFARQSIMHRGTDRKLSVRLLVTALRWDLRPVFQKRVLGHAARLVVPRGLGSRTRPTAEAHA